MSRNNDTKWFLYLVECSDESIYTGITLDIERRVKQHNTKKGAKSLFRKLPVKLVYFEEYNTHLEAARRELEIKSWKRIKKLELVTKGHSSMAE